MADSDPPDAPSPTTLGLATAVVVLKTRRYRRNLLFGLTALALFLVLGGVLYLEPLAEARPLGYLTFWLLVVGLVFFILMLAIYDLMQIRREARKELRSLEERLVEAQAEVLGEEPEEPK